ncbi:hypothetical protein ACF059_14985 [Streptomyces sp. NPDC016562]|uniref:hypothetical protein n=1 Tax=Streptomyces sp. NPDC016562 TaxID=3364966 RepID=UPI0036F8C3E7
MSLGSRPGSVTMLLSPETVQRLAQPPRSTDPALKLLAAPCRHHALYPYRTRALPLTAIDCTRGRLRRRLDQPLDALTQQAAVSGADPQHLCAVFNITPETGLRYTRFFHPDPTDSDDTSGCTMETS